MVLFSYGDFNYACRVFPQPICNLFFRQLLVHPIGGTGEAPDAALGLPIDAIQRQTILAAAGIGVQPECTIARMAAAGGLPGSAGNVANIAACSIAVLVALGLSGHAMRRLAAVGRKEMIFLLWIYALTAIFQLLDTGAFLEQGLLSIAWITAVHVGLVVIFFWTLLWNGILGFQWIEDGSLASLLPWAVGVVVLGVGSTYIALDTAFAVSNYFASDPPANLHNAWLFSLTVVWPLAASFLYFVLTTVVILVILRERRPLAFLAGAAFLFALGESARYALSYTICTGTSGKIDGSFLGTILETLAIVGIYATWKSVTEDSWTDDYGGTGSGYYV